MENIAKQSIKEKPKKKGLKKIHSRYLFFGFLSLLFGITLARKLYATDALYIAITVVSLVAILIGLLLTKRFKMLTLIFAMFFIGNGLYFAGYTSFMGKEYSGVCAVTGRVSEDIKDYGYGYSLTLDNVTINGKDGKNISLFIQNWGENEDFSIKNGDILAFESEIHHVKLFELGSFQNYYLRDNTPYSVNISSDYVTVTPIENGLKYDEKIKAKTKSLLLDNMSEGNANLCYAVLFGDKSEVDPVIKDFYSLSGVVHILTVSGLHVGFLVALLFFLLKKCNKYMRFIVLLAVLLLYNVLCGFTPSVLRASSMAIVLLISKLSGREYDNLSSLSLAGLLIVIFSPLTALDAGFLMSYFSVAGIFLLYPRLNKLLSKFIPSKIASYIALSISAQVGILPFVANFFGTFNFLTVFANLFIVPVFGFLFPVLFILFILGLIFPFFGVLLKAISWGFSGINHFAEFFGMSSAVVYLKPFPIVINIMISLAMFVFSYFLMVENVLRWFIISAIVFVSCLTLIITDIGSNEKNYLHYIDYSNEFVYAVNQNGESLLVCQNLDGIKLIEYAHLCNIKSIDYIVVFESFEDLEPIKKFGVQGVSLPSMLMLNNNYFELSKEQLFEFGNFKLKYVYINDNIVGVEFTQNNFKNFFASDTYLSYNNSNLLYSYLNDGEFTFKFMNQQSYPAPNDEGVNFYTYYNEYCDYSLSRNGNMKIKIKNNSWNLRCID